MEPTAHDPTTADLLQHVQFVRNLARRLVRDEDDVEDVVQQSFLRAVESPPRHGGNLRAWFAVVVRNVVYRQARGRKAMGDAHWRSAEETDHTESADRAAERADFQLAVSEAVHDLPEPFRTVIVMRFFDEQSIDEVAAALGVPRETVRSRQRRGLARLRESLAEGDERRGSDWRAVAVAWLGEDAISSEVAVGSGGLLAAAGAILLPFFLVAGAWWWLADDGVTNEHTALAPEPAAVARAGRDAAVDSAPTVDREAVEVGSAIPPVRVSGRAVSFESGAPVAGARLAAAVVVDEGRVRAALQSDPAGRWSGFLRDDVRLPAPDDRPAGSSSRSYAVVRAPGYAPAYVNDLPAVVGGRIDLGDVRLSHGVPVRGRVVMDGAVVPDASLWLSDDGGDVPSLARAWPVGRADDEGRFDLAGGLAPNAASPFTWTLFAVSEGRLGSRPLPVDPAAGALDVTIDLALSAGIDLRVEDAAGAAVPGALVHLWPLHTPYGDARPDVAWRDALSPELSGALAARTGDDGVARLDHLAGRSDSLPGLRTPEGGPFFCGPYDIVVDGPDGVRHRFPPIALDCDVRSERRLRLGGGGAPIRGLVVSTQDGEPIADAWIADAPGAPRRPVGRDGTFARVAATRGSIVVGAPGFLEQDVDWTFADDAESGARVCALSPARAITGTVRDEVGVPLGGVALRAEGGRRDAGFGLPPAPRRVDVRTDAEGRFRFDELEHGDWRVSVVAEAGRPWIVPESRVVAAGTHDLDWTLVDAPDAACVVRVRVVDRETGAPLRPLAAVPVRIGADAVAAPAVRCGADVVEVHGVAPGEWRLWVRVSARGAGSIDFAVAEGDAALERTLACGTQSRVEGEVRLPADAPLPDGWLVTTVFDGPGPPDDWPNLRREYGSRAMRSWVADDGSFAMDRVVAGPYRVELLADGWTGSRRVDVGPGETVRVDLTAERAGTLVLRGAWPPPDGLSLSVDAGPRGGTWHWAKTEAVGALWEVRVTLPAGERRWALGVREPAGSPRALPPTRVLASGTRALTPGETGEVHVDLPVAAGR